MNEIHQAISPPAKALRCCVIFSFHSGKCKTLCRKHFSQSIHIKTRQTQLPAQHSLDSLLSVLFNFHYALFKWHFLCALRQQNANGCWWGCTAVNSDNGGRPLIVNYPINIFIKRHLAFTAAFDFKFLEKGILVSGTHRDYTFSFASCSS